MHEKHNLKYQKCHKFQEEQLNFRMRQKGCRLMDGNCHKFTISSKLFEFVLFLIFFFKRLNLNKFCFSLDLAELKLRCLLQLLTMTCLLVHLQHHRESLVLWQRLQLLVLGEINCSLQAYPAQCTGIQCYQ